MALTNRTSNILVDHSNLEVEEWHKQGEQIQFDSGKIQTIVSSTMPSIEMTVRYNNVSQARYESLRTQYEASYASVFILNAGDEIDWRDNYLANTSNTWAFRDFSFSTDVTNRFTGTIRLLTSVFFDYTEYQSLFTQSSNYSPTTTTDTSFSALLTGNAVPYKVDYSYINNSIFSSIGGNIRFGKDKSLKKKWTVYWVLQESQFLELLMFYRKRGGIMSKFGMPKLGYGNVGKTEAVFLKDSFSYQKRVDGLYTCQADIVEVL